MLQSFGPKISAVIVGASGGLGAELAEQCRTSGLVEHLVLLSRSKPRDIAQGEHWFPLELEDESSISDASSATEAITRKINLIIVATGILHDSAEIKPEKAWRDIEPSSLEQVFRINAFGPALVAKHFLPLLTTKRKSVFAAVSARVGSISDNRLGGWYSYRASKSALNMFIRSFSIELARRNPMAACVGVHPGTVDTALSKPFQSGVRADALFSPTESARHILSVLDSIDAADSGNLLAWDGSKIPF